MHVCVIIGLVTSQAAGIHVGLKSLMSERFAHDPLRRQLGLASA